MMHFIASDIIFSLVIERKCYFFLFFQKLHSLTLIRCEQQAGAGHFFLNYFSPGVSWTSRVMTSEVNLQLQPKCDVLTPGFFRVCLWPNVPNPSTMSVLYLLYQASTAGQDTGESVERVWNPHSRLRKSLQTGCAVHIDKWRRLGVLKYVVVYTVAAETQPSHTSYWQESRWYIQPAVFLLPLFSCVSIWHTSFSTLPLCPRAGYSVVGWGKRNTKKGREYWRLRNKRDRKVGRATAVLLLQ